MTLSDNSSSFTTPPQQGPVDTATDTARLVALGVLAMRAGNGFSAATAAAASLPVPCPQAGSRLP